VTIGDDLKNFRADQERMIPIAASLAIAAIVMLTITVSTLSFHEEVILEQQKLENAQVLGEAIANIPGPYDVQRKLSSPIKYEEWICHAGDRVRYCKPVYRRTM